LETLVQNLLAQGYEADPVQLTMLAFEIEQLSPNNYVISTLRSRADEIRRLNAVRTPSGARSVGQQSLREGVTYSADASFPFVSPWVYQAWTVAGTDPRRQFGGFAESVPLPTGGASAFMPVGVHVSVGPEEGSGYRVRSIQPAAWIWIYDSPDGEFNPWTMQGKGGRLLRNVYANLGVLREQLRVLPAVNPTLPGGATRAGAVRIGQRMVVRRLPYARIPVASDVSRSVPPTPAAAAAAAPHVPAALTSDVARPLAPAAAAPPAPSAVAAPPQAAALSRSRPPALGQTNRSGARAVFVPGSRVMCQGAGSCTLFPTAGGTHYGYDILPGKEPVTVLRVQGHMLYVSDGRHTGWIDRSSVTSA
jgi:hypothetical protein